jgi:diguanylate cyclase (GGDEF)-like protein/PAS domain S-box-containing protein
LKTAWHDVVASLGAPERAAYHENAEERPSAASEARLRLLADHMPVLTWSVDRNRRLTSCSGAALQDLHPPLEPEIGREVEEAFGEDGVGFTPAEAHGLALLGESVDFEMATRGRRLRARVEPLRATSGEVLGTRGVAVDVTELRRAEEALRASVERDGLTGLPSRSAFLDEVRRALPGEAGGPRPPAVLLLNIDGLQAVNEARGHRVGDRVLVLAARRLEAVRRPGDFAARVVGDEFGLLLRDVADAAEAAERAEQVRATFESPMDVGGAELPVSASIGVALATAGHERADDLLRDAHTALLQAKIQGRARCRVLPSGLDPRAVALMRLELEVRRALDREDFKQHYEPSLSAKGGKVTGFEILLWKRSTGRP